VNPESRSRLVDSLEICYARWRSHSGICGDSAGSAVERLTFNERFECKNDGTLYQEPEPAVFVQQSVWRVPAVPGFGNTIDFDLNLVVPDPSKSLDDGAIEPWTKPKYRCCCKSEEMGQGRGVPTNMACATDAEQRRLFWKAIRKMTSKREGFFAWLERKKYKLHVRVF